jgi:hypothetical protein
MTSKAAGTALALVLATAVAAGITLATPHHAGAQSAPTAGSVRAFLESSAVQMRLEEGSWMPIDTEALEFMPAAGLVPGGGIVITRDLAEAASMGVAYEPWRWSLGDVAGVPVLRMVYVQDGEPVVTLETAVSDLHGDRIRVELRGSARYGDGIDEIEAIEVDASFIALDRIEPAARRRQGQAISGAWVLHRIGDASVHGAGMPAITYTFAPDGGFTVEAVGDGGADVAAVVAMESLRGQWLVTGRPWTKPPLEGDYEHGPLLLLYGDAPAPSVFMIVEQDGDSLAIKPLAPWPLADELGWITLHLRR